MMNRPILIILGVLVLGSAGFGLAQLGEIRKLKQNLAALDQERTALQKRIWDLQKRNGELENRFPRPMGPGGPIASAGGPAPGDMPAGNDPADASRARGRPEAGRFAAILSSPEVQKLMAVQQKAGLDGHYSALFKQLNLSPADLEKFKNLLVEKQSAVMDVMAAARAEGLTGRENRDQIRQLVSDAQAEVDNSIRSTLGEAAYTQYQNYEATVPQRNVVSQLEQRLSYSSSPLTDGQSAQLVQILAATTPANSNPGRTTAGAGLAQMFVGGARGGPAAMLAGGSSPITNEAITQAQGVLSAQQLSALQSLQQEQQASATLMQQMRANFEPRPQGTAAPTSSATPPRP
jgi:hypothetical protein